MNVALWIAQAFLAIMFLLAGITKLAQPKEKLADRMPWVEDFSGGQVRLISILEILGAIGLVFPGLTGVLPRLTPLVAIGLALLMVGAILTQLRRKDYGPIIMNVVLLLAAVFVAYGRFFVVPL
jgi:uncharacterized membrane protein YphA (DoxX/SURF4 family)